MEKTNFATTIKTVTKIFQEILNWEHANYKVPTLDVLHAEELGYAEPGVDFGEVINKMKEIYNTHKTE